MLLHNREREREREIIKFSNQDWDESIPLSLAPTLSHFRGIWMPNITIELHQKVMSKTALARDHVPKVVIERMKMSTRDTKREGTATAGAQSNGSAQTSTSTAQPFRQPVSHHNKDDFIMTRSYEQLKDIHACMMRPIKPGGIYFSGKT